MKLSLTFWSFDNVVTTYDFVIEQAVLVKIHFHVEADCVGKAYREAKTLHLLGELECMLLAEPLVPDKVDNVGFEWLAAPKLKHATDEVNE